MTAMSRGSRVSPLKRIGRTGVSSRSRPLRPQRKSRRDPVTRRNRLPPCFGIPPCTDGRGLSWSSPGRLWQCAIRPCPTRLPSAAASRRGTGVRRPVTDRGRVGDSQRIRVRVDPALGNKFRRHGFEQRPFRMAIRDMGRFPVPVFGARGTTSSAKPGTGIRDPGQADPAWSCTRAPGGNGPVVPCIRPAVFGPWDRTGAVPATWPWREYQALPP